MKAYVFPGQGAQYVGMGKDLYENNKNARELFENANQILGFNITETMFLGTEEELKQTQITQPAIFLLSTILTSVLGDKFTPDMVAGHSLGEFSALVANRCLSFEDGLRLVFKRATAMQKACEQTSSTMAVVVGMEDEKVVETCLSVTKNSGELVVAANFNCPGQVSISGSVRGIEICSEELKLQGAKRVLPLKVSGAFHSPFMSSAQEELSAAIDQTVLNTPICPVYQNYSAAPSVDVAEIKNNLKLQLTSPVRWTQSVENMIKNGADTFIEIGPGTVLQGLISKINPSVIVEGISNYQ